MMPVRRTQNWLPSIFNDFFDNDWMEKANATAPAINVFETEKEYKVELAAPGMTKEDFNVHIDEENNLVISMEKKTENKEEKKEGRYLRREFSYSKFQQTMILPDDVDKEKISAQVENGVLNINLPKFTEQEKEKAAIQAEQAKIDAEGKSEAIKIKAEAEAEANRKIAESLTPELIEKQKIDKWNGEVPKIQGSNTSTIVDTRDMTADENAE